jgi:hypothetical protein
MLAGLDQLPRLTHTNNKSPVLAALIQFSKLKFNNPKLKALRRKDGGLFYTNTYKEKLIDEINKCS